MIQTILEDYKTALKNKREPEKTVLNMILAQIKNKKIELQEEPSEADIKAILRKEAKAIQEAMQYLQRANRPDALRYEEEKLAIVQKYLPATLSFEETKKIIQSLIQQLAITDLNKQRGQLMGAIMQQYKEQVDPAIVQTIISSL